MNYPIRISQTNFTLNFTGNQMTLNNTLAFKKVTIFKNNKILLTVACSRFL